MYPDEFIFRARTQSAGPVGALVRPATAAGKVTDIAITGM